MSRTALRSEVTAVWQYWPSQLPASSPQNDGADACVVAVLGIVAAAANTIAADSLLSMRCLRSAQRSWTLLARQRPSTFSMVILILLRSMRGSGAALLVTVWSMKSSTTTLSLDSDWMAESTTTPCAVALLSISNCRSLTLDWVYMSLNSPVAPSSTCL